MSLTQFRYLEEVARCGSIRIAADRLHVAPSAISRQIKNLELEIGDSLFERHARGMVLTPSGEIYIRYARDVLHERERVRSEIDDIKGLRRGHIRVYSIDGVVAGPLSMAISAFRQKYPNVTFRLVSTGTELVTRAVRDGDADVGIAFQSSHERDVKLAHRVKDPLHAVVARSHELSAAKSIKFSDALKFAVAVPEPTFGIRKLIDQRCRSLKITIQPALETNSIESLRGFARSGAGLTMLPFLSTKHDVDLKRVCAIPFSDAVLQRSSTDICIHEKRTLPIAAREFVEHLSVVLNDWSGSAAAPSRHPQRR
jgi:DNA-binding transcriptional LysR family regulator